MSGYLNNKGGELPKFRQQGGRNPFRHVLPGLIIVIGAVVIWYFIYGRVTPPAPTPVVEKPTPASQPETAKPAAAKSAEPVQKLKVEKKSEPRTDPRFPYTDGRVVLSSKTNGWNQIIDICRMPNGKTRKVIRPTKPPTFTNASDQMLAHALSGTMDEDLPPLPISEDLEEDFVESLKTPIVINDDDSEAIQEAKRRVIAAREYIDGEMRKGRGFYEIVKEHLDQRKANSEAREQAMSIVSELKASGDVEMLNEYVEQVNEMFRERDIGEISIENNRKGGKNE